MTQAKHALELEPLDMASSRGGRPADAKQEARLRTTALINLASILEKCDEQILPAVYTWVGASFNATPTQLGAITLGRAMMQALSSPVGGVAGHFMPRGTVIAIGCWLWATMTAMFALTTSLYVAMPICAMNGVGLALVIPNVQSLTADYHASASRGQAFGTLWLTISFGGMLGALYATNTAAYNPLGIEGWRFVFFSVAIVSFITGFLNYFFVYDPTFQRQQEQAKQRFQQQQQQLQHSQQRNGQLAQASSSGGSGSGSTEKLLPTIKRLVGEIGSVVRIPTFGIIIIQGIVGSVPYASLVFLTLYFQLMGMTNASASVMVALYLAGGGLGGLLGGFIGDAAAARFPDHGRIAATQFSVIIGIPFALVLMKWLPMDGESATVTLYAVVITLFALLTSWPAPCCNNPVFAEIVPPAQRNLVYAFDRCFEGAMAACAAPLVGLMAQRWFGFSGASTVTGERAVDLNNAKALGSALLAFMIVPWIFCFFMYSGLHITYPRDRRRASERARSEEAREWQFEADELAVEEATCLMRDRSLSPPRQRSSPTNRLPGSGSSLQGSDQQQLLRREGSDRLKKTPPRRAASDVLR